jgi:carnitine 3-dehydrogenase
MRHFMQQFGPALELPWTKLVAPQLTDELIDRVVDGTSEQVGPRSIKQLERYRDDCITSVLAAIEAAKARHGLLPAE